MFSGFFNSLFRSRRKEVQFDPEIVQINQEVRRAAINLVWAHLGELIQVQQPPDSNIHSLSAQSQRPAQQQKESSLPPTRNAIETSRSSCRTRPTTVRYQKRTHSRLGEGENSAEQQHRSSGALYQATTRRPQRERTQFCHDSRPVPVSRFSTPTPSPTDHTISLSTRPPRATHHRTRATPLPECSLELPLSGLPPAPDFIGPAISRSYHLAQTAPITSPPPPLMVDSIYNGFGSAAPEKSLLLEFATVGGPSVEQPSLLFRVDDPVGQSANDNSVLTTQRRIQSTIGMVLHRLGLNLSCKSYTIWSKAGNTSEPLPRLRLAKLLFKIWEGLQSALAVTEMNNSVQSLQGLEREVQGVFYWFDETRRDVDVICAERQSEIDHLYSKYQWLFV